MYTAIYKSLKKYDAYLFVEQRDDFSKVPEQLLTLLGKLEFVMMLELTPQKKLARAEATQVIEVLKEQGYFLQMPNEAEKLGLATKSRYSSGLGET